MNLLIVFVVTWLMFGLLHYVLCIKDWRQHKLRPHAWAYAVLVFVPLVLFGVVGLVIREWMQARYPDWWETGLH